MRGGSAAVALMLAVPGAGDAWANADQLAQVQAGGTINEIRIEGAERIEPDTVRSYLTVSPGDEFNNEKLDKSLKALFATGLFADVNLQRQGDALIIRVVENPIINRVAYEGNDRFDDKSLNDEVQLKPRSVYTRTKVQADVKRILDLYRHSGRFAATVEPKVIQLPQNRVDLVFEINEGKLTSIRSINFTGNKLFSNDDLLAIVSTKESRWYRFFSTDDTYDPDRLTYDRELLRKFYLANGYADFRVVSAVAELTPDRTGFIITFALEEGERYHIGHVGVNVGLKNLKAEDLMPLLKTKEGDWYNADLVETSVTALTNAVGDRGYAFVDVRPLITRNKDARTIDLTYDIAEGPRVYVERIDIAGNVATLDKVIRREFTIAEGDAFNTSKVKRSEQNLKNLGFFKKVEVTNVPGSAPDKTVINVNVEEQSTGQLSVGTGFSTTEGLLVNATISQSNLLGTGEDLRLSGTLSEFIQLLQFSFTDPRFLDKPLAAGFDIYQTENDQQRIQDYNLYQLGADVRLGFDVYEDLRDTVRYRVQQSRLTNLASTASLFIREDAGSRTESAVGNTIVWDQRDNKIDPTGGYFLQLDESVAGLGGTVRYIKTIATGGAYYQIAPKWVIGNVTEVGDVTGLGEGVPIGDRFFVGGDNLRGFATAGIGPRDSTTDDSLGGNRYITNSLTLSVPLGLPAELGVSGRFFTDAGTLFGIDQSGPSLLDSHGLRLSSGFGVSWKSPVGPVKIDFGVPIIKQQGDQTEVVRVNFGTRF
ncbi:MAG TPA: outer membrane protein assembly factor BamA [Aliidongia sp.]|nr:outer membrane protein assembly factor BamA [Aliidongia sp.]